MWGRLKTGAFQLWAWWTALGARTPQRSDDGATALAKLMLDYNRPITTYYPSRLARGRQVSAQIHRITPLQAQGLAAILQREATYQGLNLAYAAACLYQESSFDPQAVNYNLHEHAGVRSFDGTDWGIAQESGRQARSLFPGIGEQALQKQLCDPTWAISHFAGVMADNLTWASAQLAGDPSLSQKIADLEGTARAPWTTKSRRQMAWWLATVAYNRGRTGCLQMLEGRALPVSHGLHVQVWLTKFAPLLDPTLLSELR